jgi:hypothetical protein
MGNDLKECCNRTVASGSLGIQIWCFEQRNLRSCSQIADRQEHHPDAVLDYREQERRDDAEVASLHAGSGYFAPAEFGVLI